MGEKPKMIDDYETIDYKEHYKKAFDEIDTKIAELEKKVKNLMSKDFEREL